MRATCRSRRRKASWRNILTGRFDERPRCDICRHTRGAAEADAPATIATQAEACAAAMTKTLPLLENSDPRCSFHATRQRGKGRATVERLLALVNYPKPWRAMPSENNLAPELALQTRSRPATARLERIAGRCDACARHAARRRAGAVRRGGNGIAGVSFCAAAPTLFGFLPLHHIVRTGREKPVAQVRDYAASDIGKLSPRNVNFITGPAAPPTSRGVLARGAHGPRKLHS